MWRPQSNRLNRSPGPFTRSHLGLAIKTFLGFGSRNSFMSLKVLVRDTAAVLLFAVRVFGAPSGNELLNALRDGDVTLVRRLVANGAPVNSVDEFGSSALMYAALYSSSVT